MLPDAPTTKDEIRKHIPVGSPIEQARLFMEANGFKCIPIKNERYSDDIDAQGKQITRGPTDFLYCDSGEKMTGSIIISKRWQVSFEDVAGKVAYIAVGVGLTGP